MKLRLLVIAGCLVRLQTAHAQPIGDWALSAMGLPIYHYTGFLPFPTTDNNGKAANLPEDPYFLVGNFKRGKTDKADARLIAKYCIRHQADKCLFALMDNALATLWQLAQQGGGIVYPILHTTIWVNEMVS